MTDFDPATIRHRRLRRFYEYWAGKCRDGKLPGRADIDPVDFAWALGYVTLVDRLSDGDFRVRLDASMAADFFGVDLTGKRLSEFTERGLTVLMSKTMLHLVATRAPLRVDRDVEFDHRRWRYESLVLPFAADGENVDMIASVLAMEPL
jgi:hypothetical protein